MPNYTIRVYGLWINEHQQILISDERMGRDEFTKFPGGGMEAGEGPKDCLRREWKEELNIEIEVLDHYYTTDFYQAAAFHTDTQLISIYYFVTPIHKEDQNLFSELVETFDYSLDKEEVFRWVHFSDLDEADLSFPIDQHVAGMLKKKWLAKSEP